MSKVLKGKVALVTGGSRGIGAATARALADSGADVAISYAASTDKANAIVKELEAKGVKAAAFKADQADAAAVTKLVKDVAAKFGRLDILVNNATSARANDLWRMTEEEWDLAIDVNLKGYFAMIREATPHLAGQGSGVIVNTSSGSGFGHPSAVAYSAAKEGVVGLTRTVARELGRFGVRCNAIRPLAIGKSTSEYATATSKWADVMAITMAPRDTAAPYEQATPESHPPAKIAPMVVWLCTDAASGVNGRTFHVRGDTYALLSEPGPERVIVREGGWTLDALDEVAPVELVAGLENHYRLDDRPDLQVFEP